VPWVWEGSVWLILDVINGLSTSPGQNGHR
jgi:hypothetical protein